MRLVKAWTAAVPRTPKDLENFLAANEAARPGLRPGTEKTIVWHNPEAKTRTPFSIVYLHGFSASRQETVPLAKTVAQALGANIFYTRLAGHGRDGTALAEATSDQWMADATEAVDIGRQIGDRVLVFGVSTGATLALLLAARGELDKTHALVLMSPNFMPKNWLARILRLPFGLQIVRLLKGSTYRMTVANEQQARFWTTSYPTRAAVEMMRVVGQIGSIDLGAIRTPALVFYAKGDRIVDAKTTEQRFANLGSSPKELIEITNADDAKQHVLAGDILSPSATATVSERILRFVHALDKA